MAKDRKTQPKTGTRAKPAEATSEQVAQHFMQIWQDQWQQMAGQMGDNGFGQMPFGSGLNFGQNNTHANPVPDAVTRELATAALAAAEQCLELLKQCAIRLDALATRVDQLDGRAKPASAAKPVRASKQPAHKKPVSKRTF